MLQCPNISSFFKRQKVSSTLFCSSTAIAALYKNVIYVAKWMNQKNGHQELCQVHAKKFCFIWQDIWGQCKGCWLRDILLKKNFPGASRFCSFEHWKSNAGQWQHLLFIIFIFPENTSCLLKVSSVYFS
jgi:hypothetical protein